MGGGRAALLLALLSLCAYANALDNPFVFDDGVAIERNLHIRSLRPQIALVPPRDTPVAGRPVVNASFAVDYALHGLDPRGFRTTNLALHTACAWLLFWLVRDVLRARGAASPDGVALAASAVFAVHPLASETIDYVTQRSELLVSLFLLLVLVGVARAARAESARGRRAGGALAFGACALGMATKESMAVAPVLALLFDGACCAGSLRRAWQSRRALHLGLAGNWLVLAWLHASAPRGLSVGFDVGVTPSTYLAHQMQMLTTYLARALWPHPLVLDYGWPLPLAWREVVPQTAFVALWVLLALGLWWRRPALGFPLLAGLVVLAPSSSFVPIATEVGAERRFYLPLAGLVALAAAGVAALCARARNPRHARRLAAAATALLVALLVVVTRARNRDYESGERIWRSVVAARPAQPRALLSLAKAVREEGRPDEAEALAREALRLWPHYALAEVQLAGLAEARGDLDGAELHLRRALALDPQDGEIRTNFGSLLARRGRPDLAAAEWQAALAGDPDLAYAANNLAWQRATHPDPRWRDGASAVELALRAERATAGLDAGVLDTLAASHAEMGRFDLALAAAERARARAEADGDAQLAREIAARQAEYRAGRAVRTLVSAAAGSPGSERAAPPSSSPN
ncbi:MAG TPA: tetratricopeptide repeat protein [Myxococcota bacterium]|nr:tetratricopeptide repeat protein [Myxococcota bacterium]